MRCYIAGQNNTNVRKQEFVAAHAMLDMGGYLSAYLQKTSVGFPAAASDRSQ